MRAPLTVFLCLWVLVCVCTPLAGVVRGQVTGPGVFLPCPGSDNNCVGGTSLQIGGQSICCPPGSGLNINENGAYCTGGVVVGGPGLNGATAGCATNGTWGAFGACNATQCGTSGWQVRSCIGPFFGGVNNCVGAALRPCTASAATNCTGTPPPATTTSSNSTGTNSTSSNDAAQGQVSGSFQFSCRCSCCRGAGCSSTFVGSAQANTCADPRACAVSCATVYPSQCPAPQPAPSAAVDPAQGVSVTLCTLSSAFGRASVSWTMLLLVALSAALMLNKQ